jgi:hypothetical protein
MSSTRIPVTVNVRSPSGRKPPALDIILQNISSEPVFILTWSSPLDPKAIPLGVFSFTSKRTGEEVPGISLMFRRRIPDGGYFSPSDEQNIIKIEAGEQLERAIEVNDDAMVLEKGEKYSVKAKGRWMGVWIGEHEKLPYDVGNADVLTGDFESEAVEIET